MKNIFLVLALLTTEIALSQKAQTYQNSKDQTHLCGPFSLADLQVDPFVEWYQESYNAFSLSGKSHKWAKKLKGTDVDIYIGTWCGDSKNWMPKFVKLWQELGLSTDQLHFIALYDGTEMYKQGPNGEENGKNIHRVPTFIFKKDGKEYARIVEFPANDLETDVAQIALGYPSEPNYKAASYMIDLLNTTSNEEIQSNFKTHLYTAFNLVGKPKELNTLGYVYLRSGRIDEALVVFRFNTLFFRDNPNVFDSYAEALMIAGRTEDAISNYEKVLTLDEGNENALQQLALLKESNSQD